MKEQGADHVVYSPYFTLGFSILGRCVRTGEAETHAVMFEIVVELGVVIFTTIITLKIFNGSVKLCLKEGVKSSEYIKHIRFVFNWKCPQKIGKIIKK